MTMNYPFGTSETFLEPELRFLSKNSDLQLTLVLLHRPNRSKKRYVPENTQIICISELLRFYKLIQIFQILFCMEFYCFVYKEVKIYLRFGTSKKIFKFFKQVIRDFIGSYSLYHIMRGEDKKFDLAYSYWAGSGIYYLNILKEKSIVKKVFLRAHRSDLYENYSPLGYVPYMRTYTKKMDKIYAISEHGRCYLRDYYKIDGDKLATSKLGVEFLEGRSLTSGREELRVISVSNVITVKRLDKIIEVIMNLSKELKDVKINWVHIGGGCNLEYVKTYANKCLGEVENVAYHFFGHRDHQDVISYFMNEKVDFLINLSDSEGLPVSIMEAMSFGVPVVATDVGGVAEIVNASTGLLVLRTDTPENISSKIIESISKFKCDRFRAQVSNGIREEHDAVICFSKFYKSVQSL
ncbi:glycosyltransferase [Amylibacter sp.]|nr:glycosyltransferase [Amylibacter sp.]